MPAARVVASSALTISFGLASRYCTFDGSAFHVLFQKKSGLGLVFIGCRLKYRFRVDVQDLDFGIRFRVWVLGSGFGIRFCVEVLVLDFGFRF